MVDIEIVREWLAKADEDFAFARLNFEEGLLDTPSLISYHNYRNT